MTATTATTATRRQIGTPNNIEVLLHYHTTPCPHDRHDAPAVSEARSMLINEGAIEPDHGKATYRTTKLGKAWVEALCRVPVPRQVFVDENNNLLNEL